MIRIGICDDNDLDRNTVYNMCENIFTKLKVEHEYKIFSTGKDVLAFCEDENAPQIDLLFLDIEMDNLTGIEVKDRLLEKDKVWRIVFVSNHVESVFVAFGLKTLGFVIKPAKEEQLEKWISVVLDELKGQAVIDIETAENGRIAVAVENIDYIVSEGNYTHIYWHQNGKKEAGLMVKNLKYWENELKDSTLIRVHKSYMVNLMQIAYIGKDVELKEYKDTIPLGRSYKETVKIKYQDFVKSRIRKRI